MLDKYQPSQLRAKGLDELKEFKAKVEARKAELMKVGSKLTDAQQNELNDAALLLVDLAEVIEEKEKVATEAYKVDKGSEKMVHLRIVRGRRFNPNTGKEESVPYVQKFTYGEWSLFKANYKGLGYRITAVLHDPYGEAEEVFNSQDK